MWHAFKADSSFLSSLSTLSPSIENSFAEKEKNVQFSVKQKEKNFQLFPTFESFENIAKKFKIVSILHSLTFWDCHSLNSRKLLSKISHRNVQHDMTGGFHEHQWMKEGWRTLTLYWTCDLAFLSDLKSRMNGAKWRKWSSLLLLQVGVVHQGFAPVNVSIHSLKVVFSFNLPAHFFQ